MPTALPWAYVDILRETESWPFKKQARAKPQVTSKIKSEAFKKNTNC